MEVLTGVAEGMVGWFIEVAVMEVLTGVAG